MVSIHSTWLCQPGRSVNFFTILAPGRPERFGRVAPLLFPCDIVLSSDFSRPVPPPFTPKHTTPKHTPTRFPPPVTTRSCPPFPSHFTERSVKWSRWMPCSCASASCLAPFLRFTKRSVKQKSCPHRSSALSPYPQRSRRITILKLRPSVLSIVPSQMISRSVTRFFSVHRALSASPVYSSRYSTPCCGLFPTSV